MINQIVKLKDVKDCFSLIYRIFRILPGERLFAYSKFIDCHSRWVIADSLIQRDDWFDQASSGKH